MDRRRALYGTRRGFFPLTLSLTPFEDVTILDLSIRFEYAIEEIIHGSQLLSYFELKSVENELRTRRAPRT